MKRILGLDLGSGSVGWSIVDYAFQRDQLKIVDMGVRVVPIDGGTLSKFNNGQQISVNADRTAKRTARKGYDRYSIRRKLLLDFFSKIGISISPQMMTLNRDELWQLRAKAATSKVSLEELARILYMINQKRGYKASKADLDPENKLQSKMVSGVRERYQMLKSANMTIGQWAYKEMSQDREFRIKNQVFPRAAYIEEFDAIIKVQKEYYPEILSDSNVKDLRDRVIFYQRPLKSCKHLVSPCEFEQRIAVDKEGNTIKVGPKVAQRTNPLFQLSRIWQAVNNIVMSDPLNEPVYLELHQKQILVRFLLENDKLTSTSFNKLIFNKSRQTVYHLPESLSNGIKGDKTRITIAKILGRKYSKLLNLPIEIIEKVDSKTGEITHIVSPKVVDAPYYRLWHAIYSIPDTDDLKRALSNQFGIEENEILDKLASLDLVKDGYGNMSIKAIRRILPFLMEGYMYSEACDKAGFRHSESLTKEENEARPLADKLDLLKKGELRQPIVEKILNQMINVVNDLIAKYGKFDEIVVELARSLQSSREKRAADTKRINENEKNNNRISDRIKEYGLTPTRSRILKYKLWEESDMQCLYCGASVNVTDFLKGYDAEVEHIIPRSILFDDSYSNKACACRNCNQEKGNQTAKDYMESKGENAFRDYVQRLNQLKEAKKLSQGKFDRLMWSMEEIPDDFIQRQLKETEYITKKAMEMLKSVCRTVRASNGSITDYLRHIWGWDRILHNLNLDTYRKCDRTEMVNVEHRGSSINEERIVNWSKRLDHRHHAIDALTIACTTQAFVQRLNTLNTLQGEEFNPFLEEDEKLKQRHTMLEQYALSLPHFSTKEVTTAVQNILISMKPVTKLVTPGKHYIKRHGKRVLVQKDILVPRGKLHDETIFGKIKVRDNKNRMRNETVVKYKLTDITNIKSAQSIVDRHIRELVIARLEQFKDKPKDAYTTPLYSDKAQTKEIKSVRCYTGFSNTMPVKHDKKGDAIGFANPGNNYHIAIYEDKEGRRQEHVATFMHCVERRRYGIPPIIKEPAAVWDDIFQRKEEFENEFLSQLPDINWRFCFSMQRNEMFVLGMSDNEFEEAIAKNDKVALSKNLYRVQSISSNYYNFVHQYVTDISEMAKMANKPDKRYIRISSQNGLLAQNPRKVIINRLGDIVSTT